VHRNKGFSLPEVLVALALCSVVCLAFLALLSQMQKWTWNLNQMHERDSNVRVSPLLLVRWLLPAGNNRWSGGWAGVSLKDGQLEVRSDMDGPKGFPDSLLGDSFEDIALRKQGADLQLRSGKGAFQPVLKNVADFSVHLEEQPLVSLGLSTRTDQPLMSFGKQAAQSMTLRLYLRNYRPNLFSEAP
jgi:prepilin-type N-terminal cleavage/methylation domain-containing protein